MDAFRAAVKYSLYGGKSSVALGRNALFKATHVKIVMSVGINILQIPQHITQNINITITIITCHNQHLLSLCAEAEMGSRAVASCVEGSDCDAAVPLLHH